MYKNIIEKKFLNLKNYEFKFRYEAKNLWDNFLNSLKFAPVVYSNQELDYQELNRKEKKKNDIDLSLIILAGKVPISIFSFTLEKADAEFNISSFGLPVLTPIFKDNIDIKTEERLTRFLYELVHEIALFYKVKKWISTEGYIDKKKKVSFWHKISNEKKDNIFTLNEGYININKSSGEIDKHLRKKKILIDVKRASDLWTPQTKKKISIKEWARFKELHVNVSGKQTRSNKTWDSQLDDINHNKAFVIFLYNGNELIGGAMYRYTKTTALYAIGAYDRNLFPKPVSHLAHYIAISELKKKKISWLKMGDIPFEKDFNQPSKKEISIGLFKKKFSTDIFNKYIFVHRKSL